MNKANGEDLRVRRTRKFLWDALMALIAEHDFESLTVNDICDKAMVHRTTFYKHYQDKYDLLNSGMLEMYRELVAEFDPPDVAMSSYRTDQPPAYFVRLFEHVLEQRVFYSVMLRGAGVNPFREQLRAYLVARSMERLNLLCQTLGQQPTVPAELVAYFDAGAIISALTWWAKQDFKLSANQMALHVMQLIAYGSFSLFDLPSGG